MDENGLSYRVVNDLNGELAEKFNIEMFPDHTDIWL